jgi:hypothetical protein
LIHLASLVWLLHALFGPAFDHTHPAASSCSAIASEHQSGTPHDDACPQAPHDSCPDHHHGDDGSCGFVTSGIAAPDLCDRSLFVLPTAVLTATEPHSPARDIEFAPHRGPPLRSHLLVHVLLI